MQGTSNSYTAINYRVTTPNQVTSDLATVLQFAVKSSTLSNNLALALKLPASRLSVLSVTVIDYSPTAAPVLTPPPTAEQSATPTPEPSTIHPTLSPTNLIDSVQTISTGLLVSECLKY